MDDVIDFLSQLDAVVTLRPGPGDGSPEISWGDLFFYYSPDDTVPAATQPFATIVTKDYPGFDESSQLDRADTYRVNVAAGRDAFVRWIGRSPRDPAPVDPSDTDPNAADPNAADPNAADPSAIDVVIAHPVYGELGWLSVVNPGPRTESTLTELLRTAYDLDRQRYRRHAR